MQAVGRKYISYLRHFIHPVTGPILNDEVGLWGYLRHGEALLELEREQDNRVGKILFTNHNNGFYRSS